jgi:luciferase family oxidoreductase group 1
MRLSVLDQSVAVAGRGEDDAIRDTLALAGHAEALGYHRFWLSEHHGLMSIVGSAPEILAAAVAARTTRIRVGAAGVMLPHYSALKVAEQFRVLEALAPGRIDLGVGRAPGGDPRFAQALNPAASAGAEDFPQQVVDLIAWTSQPAHGGLVAHPRGALAPPVWILGSSDYGARLAAQLGLPYAFAWFFTDGQGADEALRLYRSGYRPSARHPRPEATVCVWALAAERADEARHHALSREHWRMGRLRGRLEPLQDPDRIAAQGFRDEDSAALQQLRRKAFVGAASEVAERLRALAAALELDEIVVNSWSFDPAVRRHSYALLAREFDLAATGPT